MTPTTNHELLSEYIESHTGTQTITDPLIVSVLKEIQSRLIENKVSAPVESYPIGLQIDGEMYRAIIFDKALRGITVYSQSKKLEPMEYEIGGMYAFSDNEKEWHEGTFEGYKSKINATPWNYIRPITISPEITSAITLLKQEGYIVTKK